MPTARALNGVLRGFLTGYTSRYSDHDGYWVFGQLVAGLQSDTFDLLSSVGGELSDPRRTANEIAVARFSEQLEHAGFCRNRLRSAELHLQRLPGSVTGSVNGRPRAGYTMRLRAVVVTHTGRPFTYEVREFVAPHDPRAEHRSVRRIGAMSTAVELPAVADARSDIVEGSSPAPDAAEP